MGFADLLTLLADTNVVVGVCWPYIFQAKAMLRTRQVSFSPVCSFVLIFSATLRCYFWIGARFGLPLLFQAVISVITQLGMLGVVTKVRRMQPSSHADAGTSGAAAPRRGPLTRSFTDFQLRDFWQWDSLSDYLMFQVVFLVVMSVLTALFGEYEGYYTLLGYVSLLVEACLPAVQVFENWSRGSTQGLSLVLIITWFAGDAFKTIYALAKGEPVQFALCGALQLVCDLVILGQMFVDHRTTRSKKGNGSGRPHADTDEAAAEDIDDDTAAADDERAPLTGPTVVATAGTGLVGRFLEHAKLDAQAETEHLKHRHATAGAAAAASAVATGVSGSAHSPSSVLHHAPLAVSSSSSAASTAVHEGATGPASRNAGNASPLGFHADGANSAAAAVEDNGVGPVSTASTASTSGRSTSVSRRAGR
jgi:hypothetical protein